MRAAVRCLVAVGVVAGLTAQAQTLPAPPVSPRSVTRYEYDAEGQVTKVIRGAGTLNLETRLAYDPLNRLKAHVDPSGGVTELEHDGRDRVTQVTDPRRLVTRYPEKNGGGRQVISPDTGITDLSVDEAGRVSTRIDSRGVTARIAYDAAGRLNAIQYLQPGQPDALLVWNHSQTGPGFSFGIGRLTSTIFPGGSTQYAYNAWGEVVTSTQRVSPTAGGNSAPVTTVVGYEYTLGRLTGITYPSGRRVAIRWNGSQIASIALAKDAGSAEVLLIDQVMYQPFGTVEGWQWAMARGAQVHDRVTDLDGRIVRLRIGDVFRDIRYDEADRIVSFTHLALDGMPRPALDQNFGHDANSRLTSVVTATTSWAIAHDPNGNRTELSLSGVPSTYVTEATSNRLAAMTNPARSFGYDNAGNTTSDSAGYTASYDLPGQLAALARGGVTARYSYDTERRRIRKFTSDGPQSTVIFVYDPQGQLLGEYDAQGRAIREYVWLDDVPVAVFMPDPSDAAGAPLVYFIHTDHLNTPRMVVDREGRPRWSWMAEPFGTTAPLTNPAGLGEFMLNLRFPGQYADAESGLFYNWNRYYRKEGGDYTQSDPIGLAGGINTYAYVRGNPTSRVDPSGLLDRLVFDGTYLTGYEDMGVEFRVPAVSGPWGNGRLPEGVYDGSNFRPRNEVGNKAMQCEGRGWSLDLDPTFQTSRDLLRIHPDGNVPGTQGCIGPACGAAQRTVHDALREYFKEGWSGIPVIVRYPQ
ncbi:MULTISPECIES: RHS repeat domain-containing protein [unclassified Rhizobacter]|uniref:RHS repeat domain-containing protein n=1 Tax=unclassified Rhizobacter TaxID=2640088 RepID=UPI0009EB939B|nr:MULTISPECIES: RHS repeat-associated core domain-containing protein [unclassified Rhizobacter]